MSGHLMPAMYDNLFKSIITAGWANKSDGNVESPTGYFALITIAENEIAEMRAAIEWADDIPTGNFVTCENDIGFIYVVEFPSEVEAQSVYNEMETSYGEWMDS